MFHKSKRNTKYEPIFLTPEEKAECDKVIEDLREQERVGLEKLKKQKREMTEFKDNIRKQIKILGLSNNETIMVVCKSWEEEKVRRMAPKDRYLYNLRKSVRKKIDENRRNDLSRFYKF